MLVVTLFFVGDPMKVVYWYVPILGFGGNVDQEKLQRLFIRFYVIPNLLTWNTLLEWKTI